MVVKMTSPLVTLVIACHQLVGLCCHLVFECLSRKRTLYMLQTRQEGMRRKGFLEFLYILITGFVQIMTTNNEIDQGISIWLLKLALAVQQFGFGFFVLVAAHVVGAGRQVQKQRRVAVLFRQGIQIMCGIGGCRGSDCSSLVVAVGEWCHECSGVTNADFYPLLP